MSILRIELRRSIAPWAGLALVAVALGFLFLLSGPWWKAPAPWTGQLTTSALWLRFLLVFLWPLVAGAGAIGGMRDSRSGMAELLATTPRPAAARVARTTAALALLAGTAYLLVVATAVVEVVAHGGFVSAGFVPVVLVGLLAVIAGGWLGLAVGRLLPHPLTAPGLAVVSLVLTLVLWSVLDSSTWSSAPLLPARVALLAPALGQPHGGMITTATSVDVGQAIWFAGLAATAFLLLAAKSVRARLLGLLPVVTGVAIALPLFPAVADEVLVPDTAAAAKVCDGPVCVTKMHADALPAMASAGRDVLRLLAGLPGAPTRVEESAVAVPFNRVGPRDPAVVLVDFQAEPQLLTATGDELRLALLAGAGAPSCLPRSYSDRAEIAARTVSASWFIGELKQLPVRFSKVEPGGLIDSAWRALRQLTAAEQRRRILAVRQAFLTCQGDPLGVLVPEVL